MKKAFVFDTNFIFKNSDLKEVVNNLKNDFDVFITQVSIDERISQKVREKKHKFDEILKIEEDCKEYIDVTYKKNYDSVASYIKEGMQKNYEDCFGTNIILFVTSKNLFEEVFERSLEKIPPFLESTSDKGFKDTLIWLSIIKRFSEEDYDNIIFVTEDKGFLDKSEVLISEFKEKTGKNIEIKNASYYYELLPEEEHEMDKSIISNDELSSMRRRISDVYNALFVYKNDWEIEENRFVINDYMSVEMVKDILEKMESVYNEHIFEERISPFAIFGFRGVSKLKKYIEIADIHNAVELTDIIKKDYAGYIEQYYSAVSRIMNNYFELREDDELPF